MTRQALYPFARKLAETMCRVEPKWVDAKSLTCASHVRPPRLYNDHGWTQKDHEALLDRPRVVEP